MRNLRKLVSTHCFAAALVMALLMTGQALAQTTSEPSSEANAATLLLEKHAALSGALAQNPYRRPLFLESSESANTVSGHAYAVLDASFNTVSTTFKSPAKWCDVLILHLNTKYCHASTDSSPGKLMVSVGKKTAQPLNEAFSLEFNYRLLDASSSYIAAQLHADKGPLGTSNYRIELQATALPEGKTFLHLGYSYSYGAASRLAMLAYLSTVGSGKIGFTQIRQAEKSVYVSGLRGAIERNTMRYYLAIEAYLAALGQPPAQQLNTRLQHWFDATEEYAQQLHEVDKSSYLVMKQDEYLRQQAPVAR